MAITTPSSSGPRPTALKGSWRAALGSEDLPDPPVYFAPKGYMASESTVRQFACVFSCTRFSSPKLPNLGDCFKGDHNEIKETLVHPYLCKYKNEDCVFLTDPTQLLVKTNLETMKDLVKRAWTLDKALATTELHQQNFVYDDIE